MTEPEELDLDDHPRDPEASDADIAEQLTPADPTEEPEEVHRGLEVDEWDAVEQSHVVQLDDDYR